MAGWRDGHAGPGDTNPNGKHPAAAMIYTAPPLGLPLGLPMGLPLGQPLAPAPSIRSGTMHCRGVLWRRMFGWMVDVVLVLLIVWSIWWALVLFGLVTFA